MTLQLPKTPIHGTGSTPARNFTTSNGESFLFRRLAEIASGDRAQAAAAVQGTSTFTYGELAGRASLFADRLLEAGIRRGDRVAAVLGNGVDFLVAAFGTWKCGAVLVPLSPQLQEWEVLRYLTGTAVRAAIVGARSRELAESLCRNATTIDHLWLCQSQREWTHRQIGPSRSRELHVTPDELETVAGWPAITQYSTGSTGSPKRVTRSHEQLLGEFRAVSTVLNVRPEDRILGVAPFFHSHGLMNAAMLALLSGATLHIVDGFFARDVARLIERQRISLFPGVPFMFQLLLQQKERRDFSSLRCTLSAGAPLPADTARAFLDAYGVHVDELYGSTETGVISIGRRTDGSEPGTVGKPLPGVSVHVVDEEGNRLPVAVPGLVAIMSPFAARRYDEDVDGGESTFSSGTFYPGDLGRLTPRGEIVLCGRTRRYMNVNGSKVDPSEVEAVLLELPEIAEAAVVGVPDGVAGESIKAVVVASAPTSEEAVRRHCLRRLAAFKQPRSIEFRAQLPKSALGKVLRKYLVDGDATEGSIRGPDDTAGNARSAATTSTGWMFELSAVPPFLRVLLITDGTVTRSLEAYFAEPIEVDVLSLSQERSDRHYPEIAVERLDPIVRRRVALRGRRSGLIYAFAESIIVPARLPAEIRAKLLDERQGIGELLRESKLETYRELLSVRRMTANRWADELAVERNANVLARDYAIHFAGQPAFRIEEVFPEARFYDTHRHSPGAETPATFISPA